MRLDDATALRLNGQEALYAMHNGVEVWNSEETIVYPDELVLRVYPKDLISEQYVFMLPFRAGWVYPGHPDYELYGNHLDVYVDWGDGSPIEHFTGNLNPQHYYAVSQEYTVTVTGQSKILGGGATYPWGFEGDLIEMISWGNLGYTDISWAFRRVNSPFILPNYLPSTVIKMTGLFGECVAPFNDAAVAQWDISNITSLDYVFNTSQNITFDVSQWATSHITSFIGTFAYSDYNNPGLANLDTSSAMTMYAMFRQNYGFSIDISNWDISSLTNAGLMFLHVILDTELYSNILSGWGSQQVQPNVSFTAGFSHYNISGALGRSNLIDAGWYIEDLGLDSVIVPRVDEFKERFSGTEINPIKWDVQLVGSGTEPPHPDAMVIENGILTFTKYSDIYKSEVLYSNRVVWDIGTSLIVEVLQAAQGFYIALTTTPDNWRPWAEIYLDSTGWWYSSSDLTGYWNDSRNADTSITLPIYFKVTLLEDRIDIHTSPDGFNWTYKYHLSAANSYDPDFYKHEDFINIPYKHIYLKGPYAEATVVKVGSVNIIDINFDDLVDDFSATELDLGRWEVLAGTPDLLTSPGTLKLNNASVKSKYKYYPFGSVTVKWPLTVSGVLFHISDEDDINTRALSFEVYNDILYIMEYDVEIWSGPYIPATDHNYLRIRFDNLIAYFEASNNGSNWNTLGNSQNEFDPYFSGYLVLNGLQSSNTSYAGINAE